MAGKKIFIMMIFETANRHFSFPEFLALAAEQVREYEAHPESVSQPEYAFYTKLNLQRMKRITKVFEPDAVLVALLRSMPKQDWWVITEPWCGDSAQNLPLIAALAEAAGISLRIVLRDENEQIMNNYLTKGGKSIPILVAFDAQGKTLFRWGPRPQAAQKLFLDWKESPRGRDFEAFELEMHQWYTQNRGQDTQAELKEILQSLV